MKAFDEDFLNKLEQLKLHSKKTIQGGTGGNRRSKAKGSSIEFSDFREYSPGDDYRSIDWNAYARFEKLFIKLYMEERETNISILLDSSASMGKTDPNKAIAAKRLAAIFAYVALASYDRTCLATINKSTVGQVPYFSGKAGFPRILSFLEGIEFNGETQLNKAIKSFSPLYGKRGITILISDLFSHEGYEEGLKWLKYNHQEIVLVHLLSQQELDPGWTGPHKLIDVETNKEVQVEMTHQALNLYKRSLDDFLEGIRGFCSQMDIGYTLVNSQLSIEDIVFDSLYKAGILS